MNIEEYRSYCLSKTGVTESIPFKKLPNVLVFKILNKMFTATDLSTFDSFSIKCIPDTIEELRAQHSALQEPSYFSKKHWSQAVMDGSIPDQLLYSWLDTSYELVLANLPKKQQKALQLSAENERAK
jgi:predicted DNA-binding protein (MmcQ/YjbR family)